MLFDENAFVPLCKMTVELAYPANMCRVSIKGAPSTLRTVPQAHEDNAYAPVAGFSDRIRDYDGNFGGRGTGTGTSNGNASGAGQPSLEALLADLSPQEAATVKLFQASTVLKGIHNLKCLMELMPLPGHVISRPD